MSTTERRLHRELVPKSSRRSEHVLLRAERVRSGCRSMFALARHERQWTDVLPYDACADFSVLARHKRRSLSYVIV